MNRKKRVWRILVVVLTLVCIFVPSISMALDEEPIIEIAAKGVEEEGKEPFEESSEKAGLSLQPAPAPAAQADENAPVPPSPTEEAEQEEKSETMLFMAPAALGAIPQTIANIFPDRALADRIANALGKSYSSTVTQTELDSITELDLSAKGITNLEGMGTLNNLVSLNLMYNQLGALPAEIGNLTKLEELMADGCGLTTLPKEIGGLISLKRLTLQSNGMTSVPDEIGNLPALEVLDLSYRNSFPTFPEALCRITSLQDLGMAEVGLKNLPAKIGALTQLKKLVLEGNQIASLPKEIGRLKQLEIFGMRSNALSAVPKEFGDLESLTVINLANNMLSAVPDEITKPVNLTYIELNGNRLTQLPKGIGKLQKLEALSVYDNALTSLPDEIFDCPNLARIHAGNNNIAALPGEIGRLSKMFNLNVANNELTDLPDEIGYLRKMVTLDVSGNHLTALPETLSNLDVCYELLAANNELTFLPDALAQMPRLATLDVSGNHLTNISMLPAGVEYDATGQFVTMNGYRKDTTYPYRYKPDDGQVILWDRGYGMNEVKKNDFYSGKTFLMQRTPDGGKIEGPSGKFSINYRLDFRSSLTINPLEITIGEGEIYALAPTSDVLDGYTVSYGARVDAGQDVIRIDPLTGLIEGLRAGQAFLKVRGTVDGTDIVGETTYAVTVVERAPVLEGTRYPVIEGESKRVTDPLTGARFRIDVPLEKFVDVWVDGRLLARDTDYMLEEGSTVITLRPALLKTLENGKHTLSVQFTDGYALIEFETAIGGAPKTGDEAPLGWMIFVMAGACAALSLRLKKQFGK